MLEIAKDRIVHASVQMVKRMAVKDRGSPSSQMDLDLEVTLVLNDATEVVPPFHRFRSMLLNMLARAMALSARNTVLSSATNSRL